MVVRNLFDRPDAARGEGRALPGRVAEGPSEPASPGIVLRPLPPAPTGGALSRCDPARSGLPFEWTLNPYRGCEFGCGYCYARYTHQYLGHDDPREFEDRIYAKEDLPRLLARDLERRVGPGQRIAIGTATDPYQPAERAREVTRGCLRVFARHEGLRLSITTKSDLVARDLDLLRVIAKRSAIHVNFSVTTMDRRLARALEPRAPTPQRRVAALRALAAEGLEAGVFLMPVLPGLTDSAESIDEVARAAAAAGARYLCHQVVFLREPTRSFWRGFLRENFPALAPRYDSWFAGGAYAEADLREAVAARVARVRRRHRLADAPAAQGPADPQLTLF
jgi:DNA repair photolyase